MLTFAELFLLAFALYVLCGVVFAIVFIVRGLRTIDPAALTTGLWFKLTILPGCVALWPVLLVKWLRTARSRGMSP